MKTLKLAFVDEHSDEAVCLSGLVDPICFRQVGDINQYRDGEMYMAFAILTIQESLIDLIDRAFLTAQKMPTLKTCRFSASYTIELEQFATIQFNSDFDKKSVLKVSEIKVTNNTVSFIFSYGLSQRVWECTMFIERYMFARCRC